ncbi:Uncharacterized protein SCF082_LOCUS8309, partial [Durusdinium trenchii]
EAAIRPSASTLTELDTLDANVATFHTALNSAPLGTDFDSKIDGIKGSATSWQCDSSGPAGDCYDRLGAGFDNICVNTATGCDFPQGELLFLNGILTAFDSEIDAVSPNLRSELSVQLDAAGTEIGSFDLDCCNDLSAAKQLKADIAASLPDVSSASSSLAGVLDDVNGIDADFAALNADAFDFNSTISTVRAELITFNSSTLLTDVADFEFIFEKEEAVFNLLFNDLGGILDQLAPDVLESIARTGTTGLQDVIIHVATQLDLADSNSTSTLGEASEFDAFATPTVTGFIENDRIQPYPSDKLCLTDECIRNSIEFYNNDDIQNIAPQELNDVVAVPVSRTTAMGTPFLIPGVILIMAFCVFFIPRCGYALACCSVCTMPFLFLIIGGVIFPFLIITADTCASVESLGVAVVEELQPFLCDTINGTINGEGFCTVEVEVSEFVNSTFELDPPALVQSVLDGCTGSSFANLLDNATAPSEPIDAVFAVLGAEAGEIVTTQLAKLLDELLPGIGVTLRPVLRSEVLQTSPDLVADLDVFSTDLNSALGCEKLNAAYLGFKDTVCCDFTQAFYWSFAGWYLIAFTLLFCGLPVGCFAATRLRNIKRSRAQLREFYERTRQTQIGQGIGRGTGYAVAVVGRLVPGGGENTEVAVAQEVDENGENKAPRARGRLAQLGASFTASSNQIRARFRRNASNPDTPQTAAVQDKDLDY